MTRETEQILRYRARWAWGYNCGIRDFCNGLHLPANPFHRRSGHPQHEAWAEGWVDEAKNQEGLGGT